MSQGPLLLFVLSAPLAWVCIKSLKSFKTLEILYRPRPKLCCVLCRQRFNLCLKRCINMTQMTSVRGMRANSRMNFVLFSQKCHFIRLVLKSRMFDSPSRDTHTIGQTL